MTVYHVIHSYAFDTSEAIHVSLIYQVEKYLKHLRQNGQDTDPLELDKFLTAESVEQGFDYNEVEHLADSLEIIKEGFIAFIPEHEREIMTHAIDQFIALKGSVAGIAFA